MADVEAYVWHDRQGNITAVGRPAAGAKKIEPLVYGERHVLKLAVAPEYLRTLHLTHKIDLARGLLTRRE